MGLCPKQEFQQKSELKCKVIPHRLMCAQGVEGALEQSYPLTSVLAVLAELAIGASLRMPSGWGCIWCGGDGFISRPLTLVMSSDTVMVLPVDIRFVAF